MVYHQTWKLEKKIFSPLKLARYKLSKTIREVANAIGVSPNAIFSYEHGLANPRQKTWKKLQACLGLKGCYEDYFTQRINHHYQPGELCSVSGCNRLARQKGYCGKHYMRNYRQAKKGEEA